jgi:cellulose synthase/poly-beta-1,6-N-acetylglucosamine synthase-like glycosyltransferase
MILLEHGGTMTDVAVVVGTYGGEEWVTLARERALASAMPQASTYHVHADTLAGARNAGAMFAAGEGARWLVFLDADDELAPGYIAAMRAARSDGDPAPLLTPRVERVTRPGRAQPPRFMNEVPYRDGNWLVVGTAITSDLFHAIGGFEEWTMYEDWALFARAQKAGARVVRVPGAVYRAWRRPAGTGPSRNHAGGRNAKLRAHDEIRRAVFPELYEDAA